jgi:serine/threonine protein kinase
VLNVGSKIGQYKLVRKIGAGGMGSVFVGEHILLGRRAAIKTLLPALSQQREIVERFFNEARATSAITDPGVVQVFDFGYHVDGTAYIVMELLEGESLSARLDRLGKLSPATALRIIRQVAGALAAAHANAIIHRDLKPENIFLIRDAEAQGGERAKILDFGICKIDSPDASITQTGAMLGTPVYMSPEQCQGTGRIDQRSDVYGLGCVLFQILTGRIPFVCEGAGEFIVAHMQQDPPKPSELIAELPPAIDALVLRCLEKAPADRFQTMTDLQAAIEEIMPTLDTTTPVPAMQPPARVMLGAGFESNFDANIRAHESPPPTTVGRLEDDEPRWFITPNPTTLRSAAGEADGDEIRKPSRKSLFTILLAAAIVTLIATTFALREDEEVVALPATITAPPQGPFTVARDAEATPPPPVADVAKAAPDPTPPAPAPPVVAETNTALDATDAAVPPKLEPATTQAKPDPPKAQKPAVKRPVRRVWRKPTPRPVQQQPKTEDLYDSR